MPCMQTRGCPVYTTYLNQRLPERSLPLPRCGDTTLLCRSGFDQSLLTCFRDNAANQVRKRHALAFWGGRTLAQAFEAWVDFTSHKALAADTATKALGFWSNRAIAEAFAAWKVFVVEKQQLKEKLQHAAGFWVHCSMRSAFYGWLDGAAHAQERKLAVRKAAGFFMTRSASACRGCYGMMSHGPCTC